MKLPRWLVISMLTSSALSVLATAGWWWVTWPELATKEFVQQVAESGDKGVLVDNPVGIFHVTLPRDWSDLEPQPRSLPDFIFARQRFEIIDAHSDSLVVERGRFTALAGYR